MMHSRSLDSCSSFSLRSVSIHLHSTRAQGKLAFGWPNPWEWRLMKNSAPLVKERLVGKKDAVTHLVFLIANISALIFFVLHFHFNVLHPFLHLYLFAYCSIPHRPRHVHVWQNGKWLVILPRFKQCNRRSLGSSSSSTFALRLAANTNLLLGATMWPQQLNMSLNPPPHLERLKFIWWSDCSVTCWTGALLTFKHCVLVRTDLCELVKKKKKLL